MMRTLRSQFATLLTIASMLAMVLGVAPVVEAASAPNIITYQGRVLNSNGVPVSDSSLNMIFELYTASSGGTCVWSNSSASCATATARSVTLTSGLYSENLGDTSNSYAAIGDSIFGDNAALYLQVTIAGETLSPRKQITAAPYALNADTLDGMDSTELGQWELSTRVYEDDAAVVVGTNAAFTYGSGGTGDLRIADELEVLGDGFIDNDLVIGASTSSTETLSNGSFSLGGDDLFVAGDVGIEGTIYTDSGINTTSTITFSNSSSVSNGLHFTPTDTLTTAVNIADADVIYSVTHGSNIMAFNGTQVRALAAGSIIWEDTTGQDGNDLMTLTDNSDVGDLAVTGVITADGGINPANAGDESLGSSSKEWDALFIGDDGNGIEFGAGQEFSYVHNSADSILRLSTNQTASLDTDTAIYTYAADASNAGMTANQEIFEIGRGNIDDSASGFAELFAVDEDGDLTIAGTLTSTVSTGNFEITAPNSGAFILQNASGTDYYNHSLSTGDLTIDTRTLTIEDTSGNTLMTLSDGGSTGTLAMGSGDITCTDCLDFPAFEDTLDFDSNTQFTQNGSETLTFSNQGTGNITFDLTSTGDFIVADNGTAAMTVDDSGNVTLAGDLTVSGSLSATVDSNGTTSTSFTLDSDSSGTVDQDLFIYFEDDGLANHQLAWDDGNNRFEFNEDLRLTGGSFHATGSGTFDGNVLPANAGDENLGSTSAEWNALYIGDDGAGVSFGAAQDARIMWETSDANANALHITLPAGDGTDVSVLAVGDASVQGDLGLFNGITDNTIAVVSDDAGDYFSMDVTDAGVATLTANTGDIILSAATGLNVSPAAAGTYFLGDTSAEWGGIYLGDDSVGVSFGADQDANMIWNSTTSAVEIDGQLVVIGTDPTGTTATADGDLLVQDALEVDGATDLDSTLSVAGAVTLSSTFNCTDCVDFDDMDDTLELDASTSITMDGSETFTITNGSSDDVIVNLTSSGDFEVQQSGSTGLHINSSGAYTYTASSANYVMRSTGTADIAVNLESTGNFDVRDDGTDVLTIDDNGTMDLTPQQAAADGFDLSGNNVTTADVIDIDATGLTTGSVIDISATNTATSASGVNVVNLSLTNAQATTAETDWAGIEYLFTNNPTVAGNTERAMRITSAATANTTDNVVTSLLTLDNADTSTSGSTVVTDAIAVTVSGSLSGGIVDAVDASDSNITNALNAGTNTITGTTAVIDFTDFDVSADGAITVASDSDNPALTITPGGSMTSAIDASHANITNAISVGSNTITGSTALIDFTDFDVAADGNVTLGPDGAGDAITVNFGAAADMQALVVDASSNDSTATAGIIDLNYDTASSGAEAIDITLTAVDDNGADIIRGINMSLTIQDDTTSTDVVTGMYIDITNSDTNASGTGLTVSISDSGAGVVNEGIRVENFQSTDIDLTDGVIVAASANDSVVDAFDASDSAITNALNAGSNFILMNTTRIFDNGSNLITIEDTSGNNLMTIEDGGTTGNVAVTGTLGVTGTSTFTGAAAFDGDAFPSNAGVEILGGASSEWDGLYVGDDGVGVQWGAGQEFVSTHNSTDSILSFRTTQTATAATDYGVFTFAADTAGSGMTADAEVFEIGRGGPDDSDGGFTELFSVDEDGDVNLAGDINIGGGNITSALTLDSTFSCTDCIDFSDMDDTMELDTATSITGTAGETFTLTRTGTDASTEAGMNIGYTAGAGNSNDIYTGLSVAVTNADHTGSGNEVIGIGIGNITQDDQANEVAMSFGTGWDMEIIFDDTSPSIQMANTGALTFGDSSGGNTLMTLTDNGSTGTLALGSGDITCTDCLDYSDFDDTLELDGGTTVTGTAGETYTFTRTGTAAADENGVDIVYTPGVGNGDESYNALNISISNANHTGSTNYVAGIHVQALGTNDAEATESAIETGGNWDWNLFFTDVTANVGVSNTGSITWSDDASGTSGNTLMTLTDGGSAGALAVDDLNSVGVNMGIGNTTTQSLSMCNSADCDTVQIANNVDADAVSIGDSLDTILISGGAGSVVDFAGFDIAVTTNALTLTQQAVDTAAQTITGADLATSPALDINTSNIQASVIDIVWAAETATGAISGVEVDMTNLTGDGTTSVYGVHVNDVAGATNASEYGVYVQGGNWDYGVFSEDIVHIQPASGNVLGLTLDARNMTQGALQSMHFGAAATLAGAIAGLSIDLSSNVTDGNNAATGIVLTIPDSGSSTSRGVIVSGAEQDFGVSATEELDISVTDSTTSGTAGGAVDINAGAGADGSSAAGSNGGALTIDSGIGGDTGGAIFNGGAGGALSITAGNGGVGGAVSNAGAGGGIVITAGGGGTDGGGGGGNGGSITIASGAASGAATSGDINLTSNGQVEIDIGASGTLEVDLTRSGGASEAVCHSGTDAGYVDVNLEDCAGGPSADYAEQYPAAADVTYGHIVVPGTKTVRTYNEEQGEQFIKEVVKSSQAYQGPIVGIVSNNYGDFTSAGYNVDEADNPMPVALVGRVPVFVTNEGGAIKTGDYLTTSSTSGAAMKATRAGRVIGMALNDWDGVSETVMVQVHNSWYLGSTLDHDGTSTMITDNAVMAPVGTASEEAIDFDSYGLSLRGSAWDGVQAVNREMTLVTDITNADSYRLSVRDTAGTEVAYITNEGTMSVSGDMVIAGKLYPSNNGVAQTDKYIYYDGSSGPGGDFMRTNASGWSTGSYDFAEMFPSDQELLAGELVAFAGEGAVVARTTDTYDTTLAGIVSTRPGFLAGENIAGNFPVALAGRVPTKVNLENGPIEVGDPLTSSSIPGVAMKAVESGMIVGYALEPYTGSEENARIVVFVNVGYFAGETLGATPGAQNTASEFASGFGTNYTSLNMSGNIYMTGNEILNIGKLAGMSDTWSMDRDGTMRTEGLLKTVIKTHQGDKAETIAVTSPEAIITLSGTSKTDSGTSIIKFEDVIAEYNDVISAFAPIRVVVTPMGPVSLYVEQKDQNGFTVKRFGGNNADVEFDWMVTAYRKGFEPEEKTEEETTNDDSSESAIILSETKDLEDSSQAEPAQNDTNEEAVEDTTTQEEQTSPETTEESPEDSSENSGSVSDSAPSVSEVEEPEEPEAEANQVSPEQAPAEELLSDEGGAQAEEPSLE